MTISRSVHLLVRLFVVLTFFGVCGRFLHYYSCPNAWLAFLGSSCKGPISCKKHGCISRHLSIFPSIHPPETSQAPIWPLQTLNQPCQVPKLPSQAQNYPFWQWLRRDRRPMIPHRAIFLFLSPPPLTSNGSPVD